MSAISSEPAAIATSAASSATSTSKTPLSAQEIAVYYYLAPGNIPRIGELFHSSTGVQRRNAQEEKVKAIIQDFLSLHSTESNAVINTRWEVRAVRARGFEDCPFEGAGCDIVSYNSYEIRDLLTEQALRVSGRVFHLLCRQHRMPGQTDTLAIREYQQEYEAFRKEVTAFIES